MAKNKVIAGDYRKWSVGVAFGKPYILSFSGSLDINKDTVKAYEVVDKTTQSKDPMDAAVGGLVGGLLLGPLGMLAGIASTPAEGAHLIAIEFKDGKKSLLEVDDKIYKAIMKVMF